MARDGNSKQGESAMSVPLLVTAHHPDCPGPPLSPAKIFFSLAVLTKLINIVIKNVPQSDSFSVNFYHLKSRKGSWAKQLYLFQFQRGGVCGEYSDLMRLNAASSMLSA